MPENGTPATLAELTAHEMDEMGADSDDGTVWLPRSCYTRSQARTWLADFAGVPWIEVSALARFCRHAPEDPEADEFDGEFWVECESGEPGAFKVWRLEAGCD